VVFSLLVGARRRSAMRGGAERSGAERSEAGRSGAKRGGAERSGAERSEAGERSDGARPKGFVEQPELEALSLFNGMRKGNTLQTPATPATRGLSPPNVPN
jgi:hypothetical protein